ncbi:MAG: hypothetical protein ACK6D3_18480 [Planctomycetaceae bacterium]|jgi:hypothetical protein
MTDTPQPLEVHETEEQLITTAQEAVFQSNWIVGECAAKWTERYARGRTDADFANLVGLSPDQVYQRRRVWETFHTLRDDFPDLKWSHFYCAVTWDDARECLEWAVETHSTVAEMRAWRRARRGEDLTLESFDDVLQLHPTAAHVVAMPSEGGSLETGAGEAPEWAGERQATVAGQARETGQEGEYTPFKTGATAAPGKAPAERPSTEQLARKMTTALEKFAQAIDRQFVKEFPELPEKIQARFQRAVDDLNAALAKLP